MSKLGFWFAAWSTSLLVVGTVGVLGFSYGPGAVLMALPLALAFFVLSMWFVNVWHYAATGERLGNADWWRHP